MHLAINHRFQKTKSSPLFQDQGGVVDTAVEDSEVVEVLEQEVEEDSEETEDFGEEEGDLMTPTLLKMSLSTKSKLMKINK